MRIFLLLLVCFSCFAAKEDESWLWGTWSRVKSEASRLAENVSDCILDGDTVLAPVYDVTGSVIMKVWKQADEWWGWRGRRDVVRWGTCASGAALIAIGLYEIHDGTFFPLLPHDCVLPGKRCNIFVEIAFCFKACAVVETFRVCTWFLLKQAFRGTKYVANELYTIARDWCRTTDGWDKAFDVIFYVGASSLVLLPPPVYVGVWAATSFGVMGAILVKDGVLTKDRVKACVRYPRARDLVVGAVQGGARMACNAAYAFVCAGMDG